MKWKIDIIGVAATFLNINVTHAEINIKGYTMYRKDSCNYKEEKQVVSFYLYIRSEIISMLLKILTLVSQNMFGVKLK